MIPICPYCGKKSALTSSKEIYGGRDYGLIYICRPCGAYVGVHKGTTTPKGRLANAELRAAKIRAHGAFDPLWRKGSMKRGHAYKWLADQMGISKNDCHIGIFDLDQCNQVVSLCAKRDETQ